MVYLRYLIMANKPRIRFRGFTEDWEQRKLGDVADVRDGTHDSPKFYNDGFPLVTSKNLKDGSIDFSDCSFISKQDFDEINKRSKVDSGDILFGMIGTIGNPAIVEHTGFAIKNVALIKEGIIVNNRFIYHLLSSKVFDNYIARENAGGTQKFIALNQIRNFIFLAPTLEEQNKIIELLDYISQTITLHQCKLKKLNLAKKSLLQKLFPRNGSQIPGVRFKGFTDAWEQRKLGDIATFSKGNGYSKSDLSASGNPIILYGRLYTNYETTIRNVDTFVELKDKSVISQGGEVIVPASGETAEDISRASVVKNQGVIIGGDLNVIKVNSLLDPTFLALTISNGEQQKELSKRAQGKSVVHLHNSDLQEVNLIFPLLNEQKEISTIFEKMDNIITLHQRKLERLQEVKKGLLQKMFV